MTDRNQPTASNPTFPGRTVPMTRSAQRSDTRSAAGALDVDHTGRLWSAATALEIVAVIAQDAQAGLLLPAEAMDLIDRVRARTTPVAAPGRSGTENPGGPPPVQAN